MSAEYHQAVVLHTRPYKESSLLVHAWLQDHGKISAIYRGAKSKKKPNLCQSFALLQLKVKLPTSHDGLALIQDIEQERIYPQGSYLSQLSRLYLNELLYWLLPIDHHDDALFMHYLETIDALKDDNVSRALRYFEVSLLSSLGYSFQCDHDDKGQPIEKEHYYFMQPLSAFYLSSHHQGIKGEFIQKLDGDLTRLSDDEFKILKKLTRINLDACLQGREMKTRDLLRNYLKA
ncbi:DNA repair protein RecO [Fangia hongkongensis]|uniref:DNA repair protein RecO n=1 Tax=Fangia hongkongensis TaxID=270495 RepID=UPI000380D8D7|nr:DNA repair protein RecO [Fangia hongkongensis]MBK2125713.1 DNA repair protein RecO [Fangia hongkongensis]